MGTRDISALDMTPVREEKNGMYVLNSGLSFDPMIVNRL